MDIKNVENNFQRMRINISESLRLQKISSRELRNDDIKYLDGVYKKMSNLHNMQAWEHTIGLIGSVLKIGSCGFNQQLNTGEIVPSVTGKALSSIGEFISQSSGVATKFSESEMTLLQGSLEKLRDHLSEDTKREDEIKRLIQEINQMIDSAMEKSNRGNVSIFNR